MCDSSSINSGQTRTDADGHGRTRTDADGRGWTRTDADGRMDGRTDGRTAGWDRMGPIGICTKFITGGVTSIFHQTLLVNELLTTWARPVQTSLKRCGQPCVGRDDPGPA
eukprot:5226809-Prymnesium_polylepis.1